VGTDEKWGELWGHINEAEAQLDEDEPGAALMEIELAIAILEGMKLVIEGEEEMIP